MRGAWKVCDAVCCCARVEKIVLISQVARVKRQKVAIGPIPMHAALESAGGCLLFVARQALIGATAGVALTNSCHSWLLSVSLLLLIVHEKVEMEAGGCTLPPPGLELDLVWRWRLSC